MTRRGAWQLGLALGFVLLAGLVAGRLGQSDRPHATFAASAVGVMFVAAVTSGLIETRVARQGGELLVLGYWVGVGVRGTVGLVGAMLVGRFAVDPADRQAFCLWTLLAYLTVLVVETVRLVRDAGRARLAKMGRGGGTV